jgi:lysophospholipase L1-like esterase
MDLGSRKIYRDSTFYQRIFLRSGEVEIQSVAGSVVTTIAPHGFSTGNRAVLAFSGPRGQVFETLATRISDTEFSVPDTLPTVFTRALAIHPIAVSGTLEARIYSYPDKPQHIHTTTTFTGTQLYGEIEFTIPRAEINALKRSDHLLQVLLNDGLLYRVTLTFDGPDTLSDLEIGDNTHSIELLGGNTIGTAPGVTATLIKVGQAVTIPASGGVTIVVDPVDAFASGQSELVSIFGIRGTLSRSGATYTFTRTAAGSAVSVPNGALISVISAVVTLGLTPNGLNFDSQGMLNLGDSNSVDFPVPIELSGAETISSSQVPLEIRDGFDNALGRITQSGEILFPDGLGGVGELSFDSSGGLASLEDGNENTLYQILPDGSIRLPFGVQMGGALVEFSDGALLEFTDQAGQIALRLQPDGTLQVGRIEAQSSNLTGGPTTPSATEPAWNELNDFWRGYAPVGAATSSYTSLVAGAATTGEADDFVTRQNFVVQHSTRAFRAYFDHSSDHITALRVGGTGWAGAPADMRISWGLGLANNNSPLANQGASVFKRGLINRSPRPTVPIHFAGWSDPIYLEVTAPDCVTVGTAQNIQGSYRLTAPEGATGDSIQGAAQGGFLTDPATRWTTATTPAAAVVTADSAGTAGFRFLAAERPIDRMICVVSDSIARGISYATKPNPYLSAGNWPGLLEASLGERVGVWHQGQGGSRLAAWETNDRWFERTLNCTHLVITGGSNDLADGRNATQLQGHTTARVKIARDMGIRVIMATILPRNPFNASQNTERNAYNAWVRTNPYDGVLDFDLAIRDPASPDLMLPAYNGGDGIHPNEQGHSAMFAIINQSLFS